MRWKENRGFVLISRVNLRSRLFPEAEKNYFLHLESFSHPLSPADYSTTSTGSISTADSTNTFHRGIWIFQKYTTLLSIAKASPRADKHPERHPPTPTLTELRENRSNTRFPPPEAYLKFLSTPPPRISKRIWTKPSPLHDVMRTEFRILVP